MKNSCIRCAVFMCSLLLLNMGALLAKETFVGPPFKFIAMETLIPEGSIECVDVVVEGFEDVISMQLGYTYDPTIFRFVEVTSDVVDANDIISSSATGVSGEETITIGISNFLSTFTFPDGTILFSICFESLLSEGATMQLVPSNVANGNQSEVATTAGQFSGTDLCVVGTDVTIMNPSAALDINPNVTNANCQSSADGAISMDINGGSAPYSVFVADCDSGDIIFGPQNTGSAVAVSSTLNPGSYCVEITDSSTPSLDTMFMLTVGNDGPSIGARFDLTEPLCNGQNNGEIEVFAILDAAEQANPNSNFNFLWTSTGGQGPVVGPVLSNVGAGTYEVEITEISSGCSISQPIFLTEPAALIVDIAVTNETCDNNGMDGTAAAVTTGGAGGLTFMWDDMNSSTDSLLTNLGQGTYTVVVRDINNCPGTDTEMITGPMPPQIIGFDSMRISCVGEMDGELEVLFTDGSSPVGSNIQWTAPGGSILVGSRITNLGPGEYTVVVTAADNCSSTMMVTLGDAEEISIDMINSIITSPECNDANAITANDGGITIFILGGTAPYTYNVEGMEFVDQPNGYRVSQLFAGTYNVTVTDANGCGPVTSQFVVPSPPALMVEFSDIQGTSCFEQGPFTGTATATGLNGNGRNIFTWESGETIADVTVSTANSLMGAMQTLTYQSGNCVTDTFVIIPQPPEIILNPTITNVSCFEGDDGSIELDVMGGTGNYIFDWGVNGATMNLTNLTADLYSVIVRDENNCVKQLSLDVSEPDSLDAFITDVQDITCNGDADGLLASAFAGGTGSVSYQWSTNSIDTFSTVTGLLAGDYIVTVEDSNGCIDTAMASIVEPTPIFASAVDPPLAPCFGEQTNISVGQVSGGNGGPYTYTVNAGPTVPINNAIPVFAGEYTVTIFDGLGCRETIFITANEPPELIVNVGADQEINLGDSTFIFSSIQSSINLDTFFWTESPGESTLSCYDCTNPTASPLDDSFYTLTAIDENGCSSSDELFINVDSDRNVYIPNVFTPNGDGINDFFSPFTGVGVREVVSLTMYDRWGELVFQRENFLPRSTEIQGWDGFFRGKRANQGVYFYLAKIEFIDGVVLTYRGDVTLIHN